MGEPGGLALIPRQSSLSCETKFLAHLWKDLVFTAAGTSVDLGDPFSQGGDLRANLLRILSQRTSAITSTSAGSRRCGVLFLAFNSNLAGWEGPVRAMMRNQRCDRIEGPAEVSFA